jgi:hypothetical protein
MALNGVSWVETLITAQTDGAALTTNNVSTSIIPPAALFKFPPNYFSRIGQELRIKAHGRCTTIASAQTTHAVSVKFGSTVIFTSLFGNTAAAVTNLTWSLELMLTLRAIGAAANFIGVGEIRSVNPSGLSAVVAGSLSAVPPAPGTNFDATASQIMDFQATIITAGISSLQLHQYSVEALN